MDAIEISIKQRQSKLILQIYEAIIKGKSIPRYWILRRNPPVVIGFVWFTWQILTRSSYLKDLFLL